MTARRSTQGKAASARAEGTSQAAIAIARTLAESLDCLKFNTPSHVYNPSHYAWSGQQQYLQRYGNGTGRVLLLGMNPGPWGMAQTGVPFGEVSSVRNWLGIEAALGHPLPPQHPKYPIDGFACQRSEGSGRRFWGWASSRFGRPEAFFQRFFVWNYCPLLFIGNARNLVPEQLTRPEREPLLAACDTALAALVAALAPAAIVGIGRFAEARAGVAASGRLPVLYLHHPSPANPAANRNWDAMADATLGHWMP